MPQANEIALAKSAAPANISGRATIKVLTRSGYEVAQKGDNEFRLHSDARVFSPDVYAGAIPKSRLRSYRACADLLYAPGRAGSAALLRTANATRYAG